MLNPKKWLWSFLLLAAFAGWAHAAVTAGREYANLQPAQPTESGTKVEVVEFFWYGCPHCYTLDPALNKWVRQLPKDVEFRRIPAIPTPRWAATARTFYTLEAIGELERLHSDVFDAIHRDGVKMDNEATQLEWMAKKGVDRKKFSDAWSSFSVQSKVQRAAQLTQSYKIDSVPTMVVDGKFVTSVSMAGGQDKLMGVLDDLVAKARSERGGKTK